MCVIHINSKYKWFVTLKDKKGETAIKAFQNILNELSRKPNIRVNTATKRKFKVCNYPQNSKYENIIFNNIFFQ